MDELGPQLLPLAEKPQTVSMCCGFRDFEHKTLRVWIRKLQCSHVNPDLLTGNHISVPIHPCKKCIKLYNISNQLFSLIVKTEAEQQKKYTLTPDKTEFSKVLLQDIPILLPVCFCVHMNDCVQFSVKKMCVNDIERDWDKETATRD